MHGLAVKEDRAFCRAFQLDEGAVADGLVPFLTFDRVFPISSPVSRRRSTTLLCNRQKSQCSILLASGCVSPAYCCSSVAESRSRGDEKDITLKGLEAVQRSERVYLEAYTSILGASQEKLVSPVHAA